MEPRVRRASRIAVAALVACLPLIAGCEYKNLGIMIPGFDAYQVQGVHLWRLDSRTGRYERIGELRFERAPSLDEFGKKLNPRTEWLAYSDPTGSRQLTKVKRNRKNPDQVSLRLWYLRMEEPAYYKASVFNAAGESPLSERRIQL